MSWCAVNACSSGCSCWCWRWLWRTALYVHASTAALPSGMLAAVSGYTCMVCAVVAGGAAYATLSLDPHSQDQPAASLCTRPCVVQVPSCTFLVHMPRSCSGTCWWHLVLHCRPLSWCCQEAFCNSDDLSHVGKNVLCLHQGDVAAKA
jgi:hypothetical protein